MFLAGCVSMPPAPSPADAAVTPTPPSIQASEVHTHLPGGERPITDMPRIPPAGVAGADSIGDPYAPELGNAGYDVQHYRLALAIDPSTAQITGTVAISATSTLDRLGRISLDLVGYHVDEVLASGSPAAFYRAPTKLYVDLLHPVDAGDPFSVTVRYRGQIEARPSHWRRPDVRLGLNLVEEEGRGQLVARNQPDGARNWLPCNDHPLDKATYGIEVSVPRPLVAVSNGELVAQSEDAGWITYSWAMDVPMATYVLGLAIGQYQQVETAPAGSVAVTHYLFPSDLERGRQALASTPEMMRFLSDCLGPYPFATYGYVEVTPDIGLETQTMVALSQQILQQADLPEYMIHEHAHHWFGNSVTPASWGDIWLNEGFATYFQYLWLTRDASAAGCAFSEPDTAWLESVRTLVVEANEPAPLARPEPAKLLGINSYYKGAWLLHMLRLEIGDEAFFTLLRRYYARFAGGNARTDDFRAIAEEVTGRDLAPFFGQWLDRTGHPVIDTIWTARPAADGAIVTVQVCQRQAKLFTFPLALAFSAANGQAAEKRMIVDQAQEVFTVTLPFMPARLELDPDLHLLAELRPPEHVEALRSCTP
jgi:aminopeptidase N